MENNSEILDRIGHKSGMTVPDGYFADFAKRMADSLPPLQSQEENSKPSFWLKARPYLYMAAMFAGIWCMMKMFTLMRATDVDLSIENYPGLANALSDDTFVNEYIFPDIDEYDLFEDLYDAGVTPESIFVDETDLELVDNESIESSNE